MASLLGHNKEALADVHEQQVVKFLIFQEIVDLYSDSDSEEEDKD